MITFTITSILDPVAGALAIWMLISRRKNDRDSALLLKFLQESTFWNNWFRYAVSIAAAGLLMQTLRAGISATLEVDVLDRDMPWWVLEDIGLSMAIFGAAYILFKHRKAKP